MLALVDEIPRNFGRRKTGFLLGLPLGKGGETIMNFAAHLMALRRSRN